MSTETHTELLPLRDQIGRIIDPQAFKTILPAQNYEALRKADAILALMPDAASHEALVAALRPFAAFADAKGGSDKAKELRAVICAIMENAPYPDDIKAIEQFCNAVFAARAALSSIGGGK